MGRIARLIAFIRVVAGAVRSSDVQVDPDGGSIVTASHFADSGDDSYPLATDYVCVIDTQRTGSAAVVGYADPSNTPKAQEGDKRIYARDVASGAAVNEVWLKADGSILINNASGSIELKADGEIMSLNNGGLIKLAPSGILSIEATDRVDITAPTVNITGDIVVTSGDVVADGISLKTHTHNIQGGSSAPGPTAAPN